MTVTDAEPDARTPTPLLHAPGVDPYDELEWGLRDAVITDHRTGEAAFEQRDVEFPLCWSQTASNIVAQKYFRGRLGTPEREHVAPPADRPRRRHDRRMGRARRLLRRSRPRPTRSAPS